MNLTETREEKLKQAKKHLLAKKYALKNLAKKQDDLAYFKNKEELKNKFEDFISKINAEDVNTIAYSNRMLEALADCQMIDFDMVKVIVWMEMFFKEEFHDEKIYKMYMTLYNASIVNENIFLSRVADFLEDVYLNIKGQHYTIRDNLVNSKTI